MYTVYIGMWFWPTQLITHRLVHPAWVQYTPRPSASVDFSKLLKHPRVALCVYDVHFIERY
jgi:hypothetical protein